MKTEYIMFQKSMSFVVDQSRMYYDQIKALEEGSEEYNRIIELMKNLLNKAGQIVREAELLRK